MARCHYLWKAEGKMPEALKEVGYEPHRVCNFYESGFFWNF